MNFENQANFLFLHYCILVSHLRLPIIIQDTGDLGLSHPVALTLSADARARCDQPAYLGL